MEAQNKTFYKTLLALVLPMALQNFMNALVSASDALMLGLLNQDSLAAVSLAGQIQFILNLMLGALAGGETVLSAQYWGKGDKRAVGSILTIAWRFSISGAIVLFIGAFFFPAKLMTIYTNDPNLIALGSSYLRIVSWSYLFCGISQIYLCIMKNTGRASKSTLFGSSSVVLNIILNGILIFGLFGMPAMGIMGAAIATTCARGLEFALVMAENIKFQRENPEFSSVKEQVIEMIRPRKLLLKDYIHYMWPTMANQMIWGIAFSMFSVIMGHLGSDAVAANSIAQIAKNMAVCFCMGVGGGTGILLGNELGKGNLDYARRLGDRMVKLALLAGGISCLIFICAMPLIMKFAGVLSPTSSGYLRFMLFVCSYYMIGKAFSATLIGGVFSAGGDTRFGLICDTINMWGIILPMGFLAAFVFHAPVPVVYFLLNLDEFTKIPVEYWYYKKYRWVRNITK